MTDLPDAVVEAATRALWNIHGPARSVPELRADARAVLAAASGPWAEHLDAAKAEIVCPSCGKGCRQWNDGHITPGLWTLNCPDCGSFQLEVPETNLRAQLDAALARNAELEKRYRLDHAERDDARRRRDAAEATATALRAELDNLRDRVTALADKWQDSEFRRKQPVLAYVGLDVAARDLAADREAFDREVARKGAEVGRMNAAIVRGSDDEAETNTDLICKCGRNIPCRHCPEESPTQTVTKRPGKGSL